MDENYINGQQLAERWGIHPRTIEGWRTRGVGPRFLKMNGRVVFREADIKDYENRCLRQSTSEVLTEQGGCQA